MVRIRRRRGKAIALALWLLAVSVAYVAVQDGTTTEKKLEANRFLSPWDVSAAPPQFIGKEHVRIKAAPVKYKPKGKPEASKPTVDSQQAMCAGGLIDQH